MCRLADLDPDDMSALVRASLVRVAEHDEHAPPELRAEARKALAEWRQEGG